MLLAQYASSFDIDRDRHAKELSLGMRIASFLGALALAASVFFLFNQLTERDAPRFAAIVHFGQRFEPWIVALQKM